MEKKVNPLYEVAVRPYREVFKFSGRVARSNFWLHIVCAYLIIQVVSIVAMQYFVGASGAPFDDPEALEAMAPEELSAAMNAMFDGMKSMMMPLSLLSIIAFCAYPSMLVRRLHDTGKSGWWAAPHLFFFIVSTVGGYFVFFFLINNINSLDDPSGLQTVIFPVLFFGLFYFLTLVVAWIMAAFKSEGQENRFGPVPLPVIK